ncbi:hypothetical protein M011DRAFT_116937 [Sporormia fimetaria CBS 119925]|uniref:SET domain-containing protein n=1 Tax=Sporormia fimetaria CBS 119925 TaxID=1340428 RepID=A0A6A6VNV3_9PLEO|nr:hypothetical protein M011DRAFT_116937 [Sporormia fimetaria CBS 119925]
MEASSASPETPKEPPSETDTTAVKRPKKNKYRNRKKKAATTVPNGVETGPSHTEDTEAEDTQAEDTQAEDTQAEDTQAEDTQAEDTQAEDTQAEDTQAEDTQAEDTQAEDTSHPTEADDDGRASPTTTEEEPMWYERLPRPKEPAETHVRTDLLEPLTLYLSNGWQEKIYIAKSDIPSGTRLISEPHVLGYRGMNMEYPIDLYHDFLKLPRFARKEIMQLPPKAFLQCNLFGHETQELATRCINLSLTPHRTIEQEEDYQILLKELRIHIPAYRVALRLFAHRTRLPDPGVDPCDEDDGHMRNWGYFRETARITHSCIPNCVASYNAKTQRMAIHTTRDINMGETLTRSILGSNCWHRSAAKRRPTLDEYGVFVPCRACEPCHPDFSLHERLRESVRTLGRFAQSYEAKHPDVSEMERRAIEAKTLAVLRQLEEAGCGDVTILRWMRFLRDCVYDEWKRELAEKVRKQREGK